MASSTLDRRVSVLLVNNIIVVCALICLTFYTVSINLKLTDSLRSLESTMQESKAKDYVKTVEARQKFEKLGREILKTRQRRSLDILKMMETLKPALNKTYVPVLLQGPRGKRGPRGKTGKKGSLGVQGIKGVAGERGLRGNQGPMGIKGDQGRIGKTGPRGAVGKVGAKGEKGDRGERGFTGMKGESVAVSKITVPFSHQTVVSPGTATFSCSAVKKCVAKSIPVKAQAIIRKKKIETEEGHNITIRCEVKGNPEPIITWQKKGGITLSTAASLTDSNKTLQIANAKIADSGDYICKAVNNLATSKSNSTVSVSKRLAFVYWQRGTVTVNKMKNVTLNCIHKDGLSPVSVVWGKDGVKLKANKKTTFSMNKQVMQLKNVGMGDAGNYTCIIKSRISQIQNTVQLIVRKLHPNTCNKTRNSGSLNSGSYVISSTVNPLQLLHVYCDMDSKPGEGITLFKTCSDIKKYGQPSSDWYQLFSKEDASKSVSVYCNMSSKSSEGITVVFKTCNDIKKSGQLKSGLYQIHPSGDRSKPVSVYCDMDSNPSEGIALFKTCNGIRISGQLKSGQYQIYPTGNQNKSVSVYCDMHSKHAAGITVISHDSEARSRLQGKNPGSYKKGIVYKVALPEIKAIIQSSKKCEQFIKYDCFGSYLTASHNGIYDPATWWVSAAGQKMTNWGGADHTVKGCACSLTNSCAGGNMCNCNKNDGVWREDGGYLDEKEFLPVKELWFGDLDHPVEDSYYTLGKLKCY